MSGALTPRSGPAVPGAAVLGRRPGAGDVPVGADGAAADDPAAEDRRPPSRDQDIVCGRCCGAPRAAGPARATVRRGPPPPPSPAPVSLLAGWARPRRPGWTCWPTPSGGWRAAPLL